MTGYGDGAPVYRAAGWLGVLPLPTGKKMPPPQGYTGWLGTWPTDEQVEAWRATRADGNLLLRLHDDTLALDVDAYDDKTGGRTLKEGESRWGPLPPTYRNSARPDDPVSGHLLYRVPEGYRSVGVLKFPEQEIGDVELVQHHHRFVVAWPSVHPKTGGVYRWYDPDGEPMPEEEVPSPGDLPELTQAWLDGLRMTQENKRRSTAGRKKPDDRELPVYDVQSAVTEGSPSDKVGLRLSKALHDLCQGVSRHDTMRDHIMGLLRYGSRGEAGVGFALGSLRTRFVEATSGDRDDGEDEAAAEFERFISGAGHLLDDDPTRGGQGVAGSPRLWKATDLRPATQPRWLAKGRLPRGAVSLLIGDEGIGKSLFWVWVVAAVTTGGGKTLFPEFGIPPRDPEHVLLGAITEDDWQTVVRPRLEVAGADLDMIQVVCTDEDGSGAPTFPDDIALITGARPRPALVVVDAWLDTVPKNIVVRDPQGARQALHPWKDAATFTDAAVWLLCHTNRVSTANARDKYGITSELRKKARMALFAQTDEQGLLTVGPEKTNMSAPAAASQFAIESVPYFAPTADDDGTGPKLVYRGESAQTAREHITESYAASHGGTGGDGSEVVVWVAGFLADGPRWSRDVFTEGDKAGFSEKRLTTAKRTLHAASVRDGESKSWFWRLPQHDGMTPADGQGNQEPPQDDRVS